MFTQVSCGNRLVRCLAPLALAGVLFAPFSSASAAKGRSQGGRTWISLDRLLRERVMAVSPGRKLTVRVPVRSDGLMMLFHQMPKGEWKWDVHTLPNGAMVMERIRDRGVDIKPTLSAKGGAYLHRLEAGEYSVYFGDRGDPRLGKFWGKVAIEAL